MQECTILRYISRWEGVLLRSLNEIDIDNTPGTHPDTCHIETAPVILHGLGVKHVHFPLVPSVLTSTVHSDTKWWLILATSHMGKKLALNLSFTNLIRLNRCPYLYCIIPPEPSGLLKRFRGATAPKSQDRLKWLLPDDSTGGLVVSKALILQP